MTKPRTFLVGVTSPDYNEIKKYLNYTEQEEFLEDWDVAHRVTHPLRLCSMFAKLCYKSLVPGKNANVTKTRSIEDNIRSVIASGHGSVLEHIYFNFITTDCSRVFTHELVRHRVGTAFSQTSGRYCALDQDSQVVLDDPVLEPVRDRLGYMFDQIRKDIMELRDEMITSDMSFAEKKKITSALRRLAPSGLSNEIAWSVNLRQLRHMIEMRTSVHAEWEIREVFREVASMIDPQYLTGGTYDAETGEWKNLRV